MNKWPIFASRFSQLCRESGLSYTDLAGRLGLNRKRIYSWEDGNSEPQLMSIVKICKYFHISADWLLGLTDEREQK